MLNRNSLFFLGMTVLVIALFAFSLFLPKSSPKLSTSGELDLSKVVWLNKPEGDVSKKVVTYFFASWCSTCRSKNSDTVAQIKSHPEITWIGVLYFDELGRAQQQFPDLFAVLNGYILDERGTLAVEMGVRGTPEYLYFEDAKVVRHGYRLKEVL